MNTKVKTTVKDESKSSMYLYMYLTCTPLTAAALVSIQSPAFRINSSAKAPYAIGTR